MGLAFCAGGDAPKISGEPTIGRCRYAEHVATQRLPETGDVERDAERVGAGVGVTAVDRDPMIVVRNQMTTASAEQALLALGFADSLRRLLTFKLILRIEEAKMGKNEVHVAATPLASTTEQRAEDTANNLASHLTADRARRAFHHRFGHTFARTAAAFRA